MNFGTKGCMYNCGDECTGECIKVETKTKKMKDSDVNVYNESFKAYFLMRMREIVNTTKYKEDEKN